MAAERSDGPQKYAAACWSQCQNVTVVSNVGQANTSMAQISSKICFVLGCDCHQTLRQQRYSVDNETVLLTGSCCIYRTFRIGGQLSQPSAQQSMKPEAI